jgi:hypothetical protein
LSQLLGFNTTAIDEIALRTQWHQQTQQPECANRWR